LAHRKLKVLNTIAGLVTAKNNNSSLNDAINHAIDQVNETLLNLRGISGIEVKNTEIESALQTNGHITDPSHT